MYHSAHKGLRHCSIIIKSCSILHIKSRDIVPLLFRIADFDKSLMNTCRRGWASYVETLGNPQEQLTMLNNVGKHERNQAHFPHWKISKMFMLR